MVVTYSPPFFQASEDALHALRLPPPYPVTPVLHEAVTVLLATVTPHQVGFHQHHLEIVTEVLRWLCSQTIHDFLSLFAA